MEKLNFHLTCLFTFCIMSLVIPSECVDGDSLPKKKAALFVLGDSAFDVGNNNYIDTIGRANYWPYGETFFEHPTGRFSDGRLIPDFVAEYAKLPLIRPYLEPGNHDFEYGVNFASAGAGALLETRQGSVIDFKTQLSYFKNVSEILKQKLGNEEAKYLLARAVFLFNIGGNDYSFLFDTNTSTYRSFSPEKYVGMVIGNITFVLEEIYKIGGRKFAAVTVKNPACAPYARVLSGAENDYRCLDQITPYVELHNKEFSNLLEKLNSELEGFKYSLSDSNKFGEERTNNPSKYGFKEGKEACCGSGPYRGIFSCGGKRGLAEYYLCSNVSEYVYFDSAHVTERVNHQFVNQAWNEKPTFKGSYNLKALFEFK